MRARCRDPVAGSPGFWREGEPSHICLILTERGLGFSQQAIGGSELFEERFFIEFGQDLVFFDLTAFVEIRLVHEGLHAGADLDVLRGVKLTDERGVERSLRGGDRHHLHDWWRRHHDFRFFAPTDSEHGDGEVSPVRVSAGRSVEPRLGIARRSLGSLPLQKKIGTPDRANEMTSWVSTGILA